MKTQFRQLPAILACFFSLIVFPVESMAADIFAANKALGRGVNIGNYLDAPKGQDWGFTLRDDHLQRIREAGFDSIRLPVRWPEYAESQSPFTIDPQFFKRVDRILDQAESHRLNVVLNIHHFEDLDKDPGAHTGRFVVLWKQIAEHYRSRPASLYFELNNEPHDKLDADAWNRVLLEGLAAVRASNPTRPVIIGPTTWNNLSALPKLNLPKDDHLIVTIHYYSPFDFTHQGATWTDPKVRGIHDKPWGETDADVAAIRKDFDKALAWAKDNHRPLYVGEFGSYEKAPMPSRVRWTHAVAREAEARGFSWAYWEFGAGFGVYDPKAGQWREPLLQALIPKR